MWLQVDVSNANMKKMFRPVVDDMAFISENGGLAVYNEKVLYQDSFEQELVREIAENIYDKEGSEFTCSTKDFYYIRPKNRTFQRSDDQCRWKCPAKEINSLKKSRNRV